MKIGLYIAGLLLCLGFVPAQADDEAEAPVDATVTTKCGHWPSDPNKVEEYRACAAQVFGTSQSEEDPAAAAGEALPTSDAS